VILMFGNMYHPAPLFARALIRVTP
jgi:hypothetical protein